VSAPVVDTIGKVGSFLLEHGDLVEDIAEAFARGTPKDVIKAAIRHAKVEVSDAAMREELGLTEPKKT
jgi:hypothetical protein